MPKWDVSAAATKGVVDVVGEGRPIFILEQNCNTRETRRAYIDEVRVFIQDVRHKIGGMVEVFSIERASGASDAAVGAIGYSMIPGLYFAYVGQCGKFVETVIRDYPSYAMTVTATQVASHKAGDVYDLSLIHI